MIDLSVKAANSLRIFVHSSDGRRPREEHEPQHEQKEEDLGDNEIPSQACTPLLVDVLLHCKVSLSTEYRHKYFQTRFVVECYEEIEK